MRWIWTALHLAAAICILTVEYPVVWLKFCAFMWFFTECIRSIADRLNADVGSPAQPSKD